MDIQVVLDIGIDGRKGSWLGEEEAAGGVEGVEDKNGLSRTAGKKMRPVLQRLVGQDILLVVVAQEVMRTAWTWYSSELKWSRSRVNQSPASKE